MNKHDARELYKDFLEYAVEQGVDLERVQETYELHRLHEGEHVDAENTVHMFERMMYDFLGVQSGHDDPRLFVLMEAPSKFEVNHPYNFRAKE